MTRRLLGTLVVASCVAAVPVRAQLAVFAGDPTDPLTGAPYVMLPGVPLVSPGPDGRYGRGDDDVIDLGLVGDVDLVVRTGGSYLGGAIPPPHAGVAAAPGVTVGGGATGAGGDVLFQGIVSDGQPPLPTGNALASGELNGRPVLAIAFADLDGDGVIGQTAADGSADDQIERQEILVPAGRQAAPIVDGVATGSVALTLGAPASAGGLGIVVGAGASTGDEPFLYFDGPWIATLLPYMPPLDPDRIIGSNGVGSPDPASLLTDFELEIDDDRTFAPSPNHPILGTPYAIPLDGSSPTVDLLRAESAAASGVACMRPVDEATFVASRTSRLVPGLDPLGARVLYDATAALGIASDGPGGAIPVSCFTIDRFGNATDPPVGGYTVTLEAGPRLRIVMPDADGDPTRETLTIASANAVGILVDDAGLPAAASVEDRLLVVRDGAPLGTVGVTLAAGPGGGGDPTTAFDKGRIKLKLGNLGSTSSVTLITRVRFGGEAVNPVADGFEMTLLDGATALYERSLAPGTMSTNGAGTVFRFRDAKGTSGARISRAILRRFPKTGDYAVRVRVRDVDLGTASLPAILTLRVAVGDVAVVGDFDCVLNGSGTVMKCQR